MSLEVGAFVKSQLRIAGECDAPNVLVATHDEGAPRRGDRSRLAVLVDRARSTATGHR